MEFINILQVLSSLMLLILANANEILLTENDQMKAVNSSVAKIENVAKENNFAKIKNEKLARQSISLWPNIEQDQDLLLLEQILQDIERGRGKSNKYKKLTKFMYPLFMGVLAAKIIMIPLLLKMLTALSVSAVVMSKVALLTTAFVALKWLLSDSVYDTKDRLEFIYLPASSSSSGKPYRSAAGSFSLWDDQSWSDSDKQYVAVAPIETVQQQKYIPVNVKHEIPHKSHRNSQAGGNGWGNSIKDLFYYAQNNYNNNNIGKPFL